MVTWLARTDSLDMTPTVGIDNLIVFELVVKQAWCMNGLYDLCLSKRCRRC